MRRIPFLLLILLIVPAFSSKASDNDINGQLTVPRLERPPVLANFIDMAPKGEVEERMVKTEGFTQRNPSDGDPSTQRTEVYLGYDDKNLYAIFLAFDSEPEKVRARMNRRENVFSDDIVEIMIDTFHDQRRAYAFLTNPLGVQWDAIWTEGQGFDDSFDTLWHSEGRLTERGYAVRMAIPFKSLRFPSNSVQTWGLIFIREIRRGSFEQSTWPHVSTKIDGRLNQAATMNGLENISPGRNLQLIPYGTFRSFRLLNSEAPQGPRFQTERGDPDAGLDAKLVVKDNLTIDATANPDFSQVESDEPQVTVNQRFEVFFPEKRPFFIENANFFRSPINLVFTRRIADPQLGARITGKTGPYAIGALLMDDQAPGKLVDSDDPLQGKRAYFGIARVSRDILKQSTVGAIFTDREFDRGYNRVAGLDGRIKLNQNWITSFQGIWSSSKNREGEAFSGRAFDLVLNRNGRKFNYHLHYTDIDPDFRTQVGFIRRPDIRTVHQSISHRFRPEKDFLISWGPSLFQSSTWDHSGTRLDREYDFTLSLEFTGQTNLGLFHTEMRELLRPEDFSELTMNRDFDVRSTGFFFSTSFIKELSFNANFSKGDGINFVPLVGLAPQPAERTNAVLGVNLRPNTQLRIDNRYIMSRLDEHGSGKRVFVNHILRTRWNWQFNRKFSARVILQYDTTLTDDELTSLETRKNFNVDFLVTYLVNPWTALYLGVNSNYQNLNLLARPGTPELVRTQNDFLNDSRQVFVKYSYLLRF